MIKRKKEEFHHHKNCQHGSSKRVLTDLRTRHGFTAIPKPMLDILMTTKELKLLDIQLLLYILQETIGWNSTQIYFDVDDLVIKLGRSKIGILKTLNNLESKNIISRSKQRKHKKSRGILSIEIHHQRWKIDQVKNDVDNQIELPNQNSSSEELKSQKLPNEEISELLSSLG